MSTIIVHKYVWDASLGELVDVLKDEDPFDDFDLDDWESFLEDDAEDEEEVEELEEEEEEEVAEETAEIFAEWEEEDELETI